jgi:hypothetical protein
MSGVDPATLHRGQKETDHEVAAFNALASGADHYSLLPLTP